MQTIDDIFDDTIEDVEKNNSTQDKPKAHIIRRNVEDYLEQKALERRLTEVFDEDYSRLGW